MDVARASGPSDVNFYPRNWELVGQKKHRGFLEMLSRVTDIEQGVLSQYIGLDKICVARKKYWASRRQTTRIEDEAYCLLGIFELNMPLIYGEGTRAFQRLQEAIISSRPFDQSILAWYNMIPRDDGLREFDILASRPACFSLSGDIVSPGQDSHAGLSRYSFTTDGMHLTGTKLELPAMLHFFARRATKDEAEGVDSGIRHLVPEPRKKGERRPGTLPNSYLILDCQVGLDPGTAPVIVLFRGATSDSFFRVEGERVPRPIYRLQMYEPGYMEGEIPHGIISASLARSEKAIGRYTEHLVTKGINLQRALILIYEHDRIRAEGPPKTGATYPVTLWISPSQPWTIPVRMSISNIFPPERWDNKQLCLPTSLPEDWRSHSSETFRILGTVFLRLKGTVTDDVYLGIPHVVVVFGGKAPMGLWCQLVSPSDEDLEGCSTDTDCLAKFWERDLNYYQASGELLPKFSLEVAPNMVLKADFASHMVSVSVRHLLRLWIEDTATITGPSQVKDVEVVGET